MAVALQNSTPGGNFLNVLDPNDHEHVREILRPPGIKEDLKLMQQRSRVSLILRSPHFKKELQKIVAYQMKEGCLSANVAALKQILDSLTPHTKLSASNFTRGATMPVVPINDSKLLPAASCTKLERILRCKAASVYRLVDIFGWNTGMNNHVTVRVGSDVDEYLINPLGLLFHEVTASSLVKVDLKGTILLPGSTGLDINKQGWSLHAAVHEARPDVRCIIHLNTPATVAVSCTNIGLLPISQEAMIIGSTATYDPTVLSGFGRSTFESEQRNALASLLASKPKDCMLISVRNYGFLAIGASVEEAWSVAFNAVVACEAQLRLAGISSDELVFPEREAQDAAHTAGRTPAAVQLCSGENIGSTAWRQGELEFEAMMRRLDAAGYCTGHIYRINQIRQTGTMMTSDSVDGAVSVTSMTPKEAAAFVRRTASLGRGFRGLKDVEIPPASSSFATAFYTDEESRLAAAAEAKVKSMSLSRTHWFNSPNAYQREDIEEIGIPNPKKIPHWEDKSTTCGGTAVAILNANQFAMQGRDPNEFKQQRRKVKDCYYKDTKTAGPKSRLLHGLDSDDEDAGILSDTTDAGESCLTSPRAAISPPGTLSRSGLPSRVDPGHVVVVGAASKGIIQRDKRHNAGLYQSVYSPNPFDQVTDEELERYRENMDRKAKGLPSLEEEEAAARIEEARCAAEFARQAVEEAAARRGVGQKGHELEVSHLTSGAEASHDDTEKEEGRKDEADSGGKKKRRRFKLPSFTRKSKTSSKK